jgi:hypothetical protein
MTRRSILLLLSIFISILSFGQKLGDYYVSIPSDSTLNCRLRFLSDSTVELSNVPRHMGGRLTMDFKYTKTDTTIEILPGLLTKQDSLSLNAFGLNYFIKPLIRVTNIDGGFIDYSKSLIYVRQKDFGDNPDVTYIIDGKTFIQDGGVTDGYGLIKKSPKTNKALQKKLKGVNKDNCTIEIVRGLEAYKRFGIKRVYGVVVITTKK